MNYYIFFSSGGYYNTSYLDITNLENVKFIDNFLERNKKVYTFLFKYIYFYSRSRPIARFFKCLIFPRIYKDKFPVGTRVFIFDERTVFLLNSGYIHFLRSQFVGAKFVCVLHDRVSTLNNVKIDDIKIHFDLIYSYDSFDSNTYDLIYRPTSYSILKKFEEHKYNTPCRDVVFIGQVKDRLPKILMFYNKLLSAGLDFEFYLINVDAQYKVELPNIRYCDWMDYSDALKLTLEFKCIIEIMQGHSKNITFRTWEAISYNRYLLTDNFFLKETSFFNKENMFFFDENLANLKLRLKNFSVQYSGEENLSPTQLLEEIDEELCNAK